MFGEHDKWVHGNSLYEEVLRIPLIISYPGQIEAGQVIEEPVHMMDITPTLLEMAGLQVPENMEGVSLLPQMLGQTPAVDRLIVSEMEGESNPGGLTYWIAPHTPLYAVKREGWKLIHTPQAPHLDQLYELQEAPMYELENLANVKSEKVDALFAEMQTFFGVPDQFLYMPVVERN
jgi:arylsulfatase A-like enzyme